MAATDAADLGPTGPVGQPGFDSEAFMNKHPWVRELLADVIYVLGAKDVLERRVPDDTFGRTVGLWLEDLAAGWLASAGFPPVAVQAMIENFEELAATSPLGTLKD